MKKFFYKRIMAFILTFMMVFGMVPAVPVSAAAQQFTVNVLASPSNGGTVTGGGTFNRGEQFTIQATPNPGWAFDGWINHHGAFLSGRATMTFTASANSTLEAQFVQWGQPSRLRFSIHTTTSPQLGGNIVATSGWDTSFGNGEIVVRTAFENPGWAFVGWYSNGVRVTDNARVEIRMLEDVRLEARFEQTQQTQQQFTISASAVPADGGTVTGGGTFNAGERYTLVATPNPGWTFQGWLSATNVTNIFFHTDTSYSNNAWENVAYRAHFRQVGQQQQNQQFTITTSASPASGGTVTGGGTFNQGAAVNLIATPNNDWTFDGWYEGNTRVNSNATLNFTATATRTLQARFTPQNQQFIITTSASPANGGTVTGGGTFNQWTSINLTATPNDGWVFDGWYEGNTQVNLSSQWRSFIVNTNRTIEARFSIAPDITTPIVRPPARVPAGTTVQLPNRGRPESATHRVNHWRLMDAGTTGATIMDRYPNVMTTGFTLRTGSPGVATVRGSISYDYYKDFTITVFSDDSVSHFDPGIDGFSFSNTRTSFGYPQGYRIPLDVWVSVLGFSRGSLFYNQSRAWAGSCFGFSASSVLFNRRSLLPSDFGAVASTTFSIPVPRNPTSPVTRLIEQYQISWFLFMDYNKNWNNVRALIDAVQNFQSTGLDPVVLWYHDQFGGEQWPCGMAHAVVAYRVEEEADKYVIFLYDNWNVGATAFMYIPKDLNIRNIRITNQPFVVPRLIGFIRESSFREVFLAPVPIDMMISVNHDNVEIVNSAGIPLSQIEGAYEVIAAPSMEFTSTIFRVPEDKYFIRATDGGTISMDIPIEIMIADQESYISIEIEHSVSEIAVELGEMPSVELTDVVGDVEVRLRSISRRFSERTTRRRGSRGRNSFEIEFTPIEYAPDHTGFAASVHYDSEAFETFENHVIIQHDEIPTTEDIAYLYEALQNIGNGIAYEDLILIDQSFAVDSTPDTIPGDLTGDGTVGMADLILMKRFFAGHDVDINLAAADVNGDGVVDMADLILFMRYFTEPGIVLGPQR